MKTTDTAPDVSTGIATTTTTAKPQTRPAAPATAEAKPDPNAPDALGRLPWEQWGVRKQTTAADLRSARILRHWADGREVTEAEFDAAVAAGRNLVFR